MRTFITAALVFLATYTAIQHFAKPGLFAGQQQQTITRISYDI